MDGHRPGALELEKGIYLVQVTEKNKFSRHSLKIFAEILLWHCILARGWFAVADFSTAFPMVVWRVDHPSVVSNIYKKS